MHKQIDPFFIVSSQRSREPRCCDMLNNHNQLSVPAEERSSFGFLSGPGARYGDLRQRRNVDLARSNPATLVVKDNLIPDPGAV